METPTKDVKKQPTTATPQTGNGKERKEREPLTREQRSIRAKATDCRACIQAVSEAVNNGVPVPNDVVLALGDFTSKTTAWMFSIPVK